MIAQKHQPPATFPDTLAGHRARANYFESLYKHEKLANAKLRARVFGRSSEKLTDAQRELFGLPPDAPPPPLSDAAKAMMKEARKGTDDRGSDEPKRQGGGRRRDRFENLPQVVELIHPPLEERVGKVWATQEITEVVERQPARDYRLLTVRSIWMDPKHQSKPVIADLPPELQVFPGSMYGLSFMISVILSKYEDHLPLYRQAGIDARGGVWISRQQRVRIVDNAAHLLITIAEQLKWKVLLSRYLQIDETLTKVMDPERRGRSHDAYFWGFLAPHEKAVYMKFTVERCEKTLFEFFPVGWHADVQTDGASWYASAFPDMPFLKHFECIAHLRRYVLAAMVAHEAEMAPILKDITELYRIERRVKRLKLTLEQRGLYRHALAKPILKPMRKAFWELKHDPKKTARLEGDGLEAVTYAHRRWQHLASYAKAANGHINIDNNPIERRFRPTKIGLKNWMAIGHPDAGWRAAVLYTVLGTCKLLNVNPEAYLRWVLPQLAVGTNHTTAEGLLPHDFAALFPEHVMPPVKH